MTSQSNDAHWSRSGESPEPIPGRPASARVVDPEDDLTPVGYPGDFGTTTVIPYTNPVASGGPAAGGYHVLDQQEPLPYVQPQPVVQPPAAQVTDIDADRHKGRVRAGDRRGTQHLGLLILRVGLGGVLLAHGLQKLFGWWGGEGLTGFKNALSDIGYQHADVLTYCAAGGEIAAGVLLVLGLFTPLAAAGALAYLTNSLLAGISAQHNGRSFPYFLPNGHEYEITLIVMAAAVILIGPGRYGFDAGRGWARRPFIGSFAALLVGIGAGVAVWVLLNGTNPVS